MNSDQRINKVEEDAEDQFNVDPFDDIKDSQDGEEQPKQSSKKLKKLKKSKKNKKDKKKKKKKRYEEEDQLANDDLGYDEQQDYESNERNSMFESEAESDNEAEEEEDISAQIDEEERKRFNEQMKNRITQNYLDRFKDKSEKQINDLYSKQVHKRRQNEEMFPGEKDPKLYVVNVKPKTEQQMALVILNKARHLANTTNKVTIVSALAMKKKYPGRIFVQAFSEKDIRESLDGFNNVLLTRKINELDTESYANLFSEKVENKPVYEPKMFIRIKKGLYQGDLGKIFRVKKSSVDVIVVPRLNVQDIVIKLREQTSKMTDPKAILDKKDELLKIFINHRANNYKQRPNKTYITRQNLADLRDVPSISNLRLCDVDGLPNGLIIVNYRFDEIQKVQGTFLPIDIMPFTREGNFLQQIREDRKNFLTGVNFKKGEQVEIIAGQLAKHFGILLDIRDNIGILKCMNKEMKGQILQEPLEHLAKRFKERQRVKVISGADAGKTGLILSVQPKLVQIWTDNGNSIKINKKNLELHYGEVICSQNVHGLKKDDLIKTSKGSVGIVLQTRKDNIKILDVNNSVQIISNMDFDSVLNTHNFIAKNNRSGEDITSGSTVIIKKGIHEGKRCKVIHVYLQYVFLFNQGFDRTGGVSVQIADNCSLVAKRDVSRGIINSKNTSNDYDDLTIGKTITLKTGALKGYQGVIKVINKETIQVRVPSKSCTVSIPREKIDTQSETQQIGKTPNRRGGPSLTHIYAASPMINKY